ncbi:hypothetical protein H0W91_02920 [Patescibacteria group bacterium]|nr:hypothetical protein [Patescibacteria group bacterium]
MIARKKTFFLGIFIFLIPFLGLPSAWKTLCITISGLILVGLSTKIILPRKVTTRPRTKKEKVTSVYVESIPAYRETENNSPTGKVIDLE